eukprot:scaffold75715_cov17-Tisochrysis_lutea.AAC.1
MLPLRLSVCSRFCASRGPAAGALTSLVAAPAAVAPVAAAGLWQLPPTSAASVTAAASPPSTPSRDCPPCPCSCGTATAAFSHSQLPCCCWAWCCSGTHGSFGSRGVPDGNGSCNAWPASEAPAGGAAASCAAAPAAAGDG